MRAEPISPALLAEYVASRIVEFENGGWVRVAVDGAPAAFPERLADSLPELLRVRGRAVLRVSARDFLRPASLRLEFGRTDPDVFYDEWLDAKGLDREVLAPLGPGGSGRVLPALWDADADRAVRAEYVELPRRGVVVVEGPLLLGRGLPFDFSVHLRLSPEALARRTPADEAWMLPAYARYEDEVDPARTADVVVRADDTRQPALVSWA